MKEPAFVLASHMFDTPDGKTTHGLFRGSDRFTVVAVVDPDVAGRDAGEVLDGRPAGIPVVADLDEAMMLDSKGCTPDEFGRCRAGYREKLGIPVVEPLTEGVEALVPAIRASVDRERARDAA